MALSRILPEFGSKSSQNSTVISDVALEDQKLDSYEAGYQAGWDDSAKANSDAGHQVSADFSQNMRDLSMTYREAYGTLMKDVRPLLTQIVETVLPQIARATLGPRVLELIEAEMAAGPHAELVLFAAADDKALLQPMIDGLDESLKVDLRIDATLLSGQVRLSFDGTQEQELDTAALTEGIQSALHAFFEHQNEASEEARDYTGPEVDALKETA